MSEITNPTLDRAAAVPAPNESASGDVLNPPLSTDVRLAASTETIVNPPLDIDAGGRGGGRESLGNPPLDLAGPAGEFGLANPVVDAGELERLFERRVSEAPVPHAAEERPISARSASSTSDGGSTRKKSASKRASARRRQTGTQ